MKLKNHKMGWPQVALASVAIVAFVAVWILAPEDRDTIERAVLAVWALASTFLGPAIRRKFEHELLDDEEETKP